MTQPCLQPCKRFCENKTFNTAQAAHSHEKRFHGEHGFTKCSYCPRIFRNSPEGTRFITRHIRGHARKFEKCKYQCQNAKNGKNSNCIFGTDSKEELEKHQKDCSMRTSVIAPNPHFKVRSDICLLGLYLYSFRRCFVPLSLTEVAIHFIFIPRVINRQMMLFKVHLEISKYPIVNRV